MYIKPFTFQVSITPCSSPFEFANILVEVIEEIRLEKLRQKLLANANENFYSYMCVDSYFNVSMALYYDK